MIAVSDTYKRLMDLNMRPKIEPVITVSGIDNTGSETSLTWKAKDIKDLTYKRGVDPTGRSAPYMELTWTEIYKGKLNAQNYPEKYNNIVKYMAVELSFSQSLGFFNTWKYLYDSNITWKQLFDSGTTWKQLETTVNAETITLPKLYLTARPTIDGATITWTAKDLLSFLNEQQFKAYNVARVPRPGGATVINGFQFVNPLIYLILNARGSFLDSPQIFDALTATATELENIEPSLIGQQLLFNDSTKNCLVNYANLEDYHWNFLNDIMVLRKIPNESTGYKFSKKVIHSYPKITNGTNISTYDFKNYRLEIDVESPYVKTSEAQYINNAPAKFWTFKEFGTLSDDSDAALEINFAIGSNSMDSELTVYPVNHNSYDNTINNSGKAGESYVEDNPINPYSKDSYRSADRLAFLDSYFNQDCSSLEFSGLANVAIEAGDIIKVDTNLFDENAERIEKDALVLSLELTYNGALKEKIIAHEVKL